MVKKIASRSVIPKTIKYSSVVLGVTAVLLLVTLLVLPRPNHKTGFVSLPQVEQYASSLLEQYEMDNENTIKPEFTKYWATLVPSRLALMKEKLAWLGSFLYLANPPAWSPSFFKHQLVSLATARQAAASKGDSIVKITATPQSKIIIFGYVQGAIHSLTRCLVQLKALGLLNDELVLTNQDTFLVFTGGIVSRSPHNMATLSLVCRLLEKNPGHVVYLAGTHESKNYWQEHALKNELVLFAQHLGAGDVPLANEVNVFFKTLPIAAYITMNGPESKDFIRISDAGRGQNEQLTEADYVGFLTSKSDKPVTTHFLGAKAEGKGEVKIDVIFKGEKKRESYQPHQGLRLLQADMDSVAWATLSSPTAVYQKAIKFVHDAFVVVAAAGKIADWTVTLYNRDVRTKDPFKATVFNLLTGADVATGAKPTAQDEKEELKKDDKLEKKVEKKEEALGSMAAKKEPEIPAQEKVQVVKESQEQLPSLALETTTTSTMAQVTAIKQQLVQLTKEVAVLADRVAQEAGRAGEKPVNVPAAEIKVGAQVAAKTEDAEPSAFKPL
jgi:hypothetical protein